MASHMVAIAIATATVHVDDGRWNEIRCMSKVIAFSPVKCHYIGNQETISQKFEGQNFLV